MRHGNWFQLGSFCFLKALFEVNASGLQLSFNQFRQFLTGQTIQTKYIKL